MKKKSLLFLVFVFCLTILPTQAHAITIDQRCWKKSACLATRQATNVKFGDQNAEAGFVQNGETIAACGASGGEKNEPLGFCLPVGQTETKISFGGKHKFSDIGDFIRYMYRYSILIAGILSTLMIIVAGMQWVTSGGNSSTIETAKKRIGGALMGLTVALLSYSILNFVNPNLVNFRLPEIWLINTIKITGSPYCADQIPSTKIALFKKQGDATVDEAKAKERFQGGPYDKSYLEGECTVNYFIEGAGGQFCHGTVCAKPGTKEQDPSKICGPVNDKSGNDTCYDGDIIGTLVNVPHGLFRSTETWEDFPWVDDGTEQIYGLCTTGKYFPIDASSTPNKNEHDHLYQFLMKIVGGVDGLKKSVEDKCGGTDEKAFKGFFLKLQMNENWDVTDEDHYIGVDKNGTGIDLGDQEALDYMAPQLKPDYLFPWKKFINTEDGAEKLGGKIVVKININDIADLDNGKDYGGDSSADEERQKLYHNLGIK